ncbi:hypothetical protein COX97_00590 [Candidatus Pacearchaeota archaeon CG_4_10_14_0_2_um_filter_05_32_18]|nr:MAG: hypothetical protein AUJ62_03230 [Candidatus Pacearchaeota archaeon CG1_02_32_21]PIZ83730.1 MAG: hypothetical protein COX97_00590 [Candidatus Pacearchaeota archaeon CG_4_10_14_0_2_um_filter_05_32_18]
MRFKEASFYKKLNDKKVHCKLCPHKCIIGNGETGKCKIKQNVDGKLKAMNYGKIYLSRTNSIEELGFFHFLPGNEALLVSSIGNSLDKGWYENELTGKEIEDIPIINQTPTQLGKEVLKKKLKIICHGYNEPMMSYEYVEDIIANNKSTKHVVQTNAFIEQEPIGEISKKLNGAVIEIRGMTEEFYKNILDGDLDSVLKSTKTMHEGGVWIEIFMPVITEIHYSLYDVRKLISWILNNLGADVPLHFVSKNYVDEQLLKKSRKIAVDAGMRYVYSHVPGWNEGITTFCPECKKAVIVRENDSILENNIKEGKCTCGKQIPGVWQ